MLKMIIGARSVAVFALLQLHGGGSMAQEAVVTLRSTVTGNQEQPRVMYIVPWQPPGEMALEHSLASEVADELFAPLDRDEFVRGIKYRAMLEEPKVQPGSADD